MTLSVNILMLVFVNTNQNVDINTQQKNVSQNVIEELVIKDTENPVRMKSTASIKTNVNTNTTINLLIKTFSI